MKEQLSTDYQSFKTSCESVTLTPVLGSKEMSYSSTFQKHYFHTHSQHVYV